MAASSEQCAVAVDGSLLDASAIVFYNDPDDDTPLPSSKSATTLTQVHPFFQGGSAPAAARCSYRLEPLSCLLDLCLSYHILVNLLLGLPQFGPELKFKPELFRTGPKFGPGFDHFAEPDHKFSSGFGEICKLGEPS